MWPQHQLYSLLTNYGKAAVYISTVDCILQQKLLVYITAIPDLTICTLRLIISNIK